MTLGIKENIFVSFVVRIQVLRLVPLTVQKRGKKHTEKKSKESFSRHLSLLSKVCYFPPHKSRSGGSSNVSGAGRRTTAELHA